MIPEAAPRTIARPARTVSSPLRIAILCDFAPRKLGSWEGWLAAFAREARSRGHELTVFGREPIHPAIREGLEGAGSRWQLLSQLEHHPLRAVRLLRESFDVIQLNYVAPRQIAALAAYAAKSTPVLFVDHNSIPDPTEVERRPRLAHWLDVVTMRRVRYHVGVSEYVSAYARRRYELPQSRSRTIHNGVDLSRYHPSGRNGALPDFSILTVANLIAEKGVEHLVRAVAMLGREGVRLRIAGDGPELPRLRQLVSELQIGGRTEFLGLRDDLPDLLRQADVFVHPAVWQEAFGFTVAEAMATGRPVVASRIGAMVELLDERSGILVPPGDPAALAGALRHLCADRALRCALGEGARRRAVELFGLDRCISRHLDLCEEAAR